MQQPKIESTPKKRKASLFRKTLKTAIATVVVVGIFWLGIGVGSGRISIGIGGYRTQQTGLSSQLDYTSVNQVYNLLQKNFDGELDEAALIEGLKKGLVEAAGDPYTEYLNAEQTKDFDEELTGSFDGIGAELSEEEDRIVIISPIAGFPAEKAGLRAKDVIAEVNGENTYNMGLTEAVQKIRGPKDSKVSLKIIRNNNQELTFDIVRDTITIPSVKSEILPGNIGYMQISRFAKDTAGLARKAATDFKQQGVKGVILDLRSNPGGLVNSAVDTASLWVPNNKVVLEERRGNVTLKRFTATGNPVLNGVPTIVLIDEGSASSSEILAGALQDNDVASLLGVNTYGKGSVQQIERLPLGTALKVTIARWYTPNGRNIDKEGIEPSTVVELTEEDFVNGRDPQKDAAIQKLVNGN